MFKASCFSCDVYDYFLGRGSCIIRSVGGILLGGATNSCLRGCRDGSFLFIIMLLDVGPDGGKASRMKLFSGLAAAFSISLLIVLFLIIVQDSGWLSERVLEFVARHFTACSVVKI